MWRLSYNKDEAAWVLDKFDPEEPCGRCGGDSHRCETCQGLGLKRRSQTLEMSVTIRGVTVTTELWRSPGVDPDRDETYGRTRGYLLLIPEDEA